MYPHACDRRTFGTQALLLGRAVDATLSSKATRVRLTQDFSFSHSNGSVSLTPSSSSSSFEFVLLLILFLITFPCPFLALYVRPISVSKAHSRSAQDACSDEPSTEYLGNGSFTLFVLPSRSTKICSRRGGGCANEPAA